MLPATHTCKLLVRQTIQNANTDGRDEARKKNYKIKTKRNQIAKDVQVLKTLLLAMKLTKFLKRKSEKKRKNSVSQEN